MQPKVILHPLSPAHLALATVSAQRSKLSSPPSNHRTSEVASEQAIDATNADDTYPQRDYICTYCQQHFTDLNAFADHNCPNQNSDSEDN